MGQGVPYIQREKAQWQEELSRLQQEYQQKQALGLRLDMSRGKPETAQLDLSMPMLDTLGSQDILKDVSGTDVRNYGGLDGIPEAKQMFADLLEVETDEVIVAGNSSLNLMYDSVARAMQFGVFGSENPWNAYDKIKFLCPAPGYDRHFAICELFGIEMITIPMGKDGPDMDLIEQYVAEDETVKGIWCVPMYSNPQGITYSDDVVRRFANLTPKAKDFRIFWDNAYCIHHLTDTPDRLLNLIAECKKTGKEDMVYEFASTSKVSFSGAGVAVMAGSKANMQFIKKQMTIQLIGFDKINQLRHVRYFKNVDGLKAHMEKHRQLMAPKFQTVLTMLEQELGGLDVASWIKPHGGYFISVDVMEGCAKRVVQLCAEAGVVLTPAGATYPYGKDPKDSNIRLAPSYPPIKELEMATELLILSIKIAALEKLLAE